MTHHERGKTITAVHKLSVLIPVYNEKDTILEVINRVKNAPIEIDTEIVIADDVSTDGTREILQNLHDDQIKIVLRENNEGKGAAVQTAIEHATGDLLLIQDADLEYDPSDYPALLAPLLDGRADVVFGTRFLGGTHRVLYYRHYVGNKLITFFSNLLTNLNLTDVEAGYKVFRKNMLKDIRIESKRFGLEPELAAKMAKKNCRIYEVPISYSGRTYAEGKKITWRDGIAAIWWIIKYNLLG